jgi:LacI family transcriptional regulator
LNNEYKPEKRVTIKDISQRLNITPTTVTKALNGKPKISATLRAEVIKVAKEMNYKPNKSAKALSRNELTIGVVYPTEPKEFYYHIEKGLQEETNNLMDYKVNTLMYPVSGLNAVADVQKSLDELYGRGIDGLVLSPGFNSFEYGDILDKFGAHNIPVVYLVNEVDKKSGLGCVCMDGITAGRMAAQFLSFCIHGDCNVVVLSCNKEIRVQHDCINGFIQESKKHDINIKGVFETQDDKKIAYYLTEKLLSDMPEVNGIYVSSFNTAAVCQCLIDHKKDRGIKVIGQDIFDEMTKYMQNDSQQATLFQDPREQGRRAVRILYNHLIGETVSDSYFFITPQIVFTSNLDIYYKK